MRDQLIPFLVAILIAQTVAMASLIVAPDILFSRPQHNQQTQNDSGRSANKENPAANSMSLEVRIGKFLDDHNGAINAIATGVIAVLTIALVIFNRSLVRLVLRQTEDARQVSERQAGETKDQLAIAKQAAIAATDAAKASDKQARIADETAEKQLRAYITISETHICNIAEVFPPKAFFQVKNSGQTPAYNVRLFCQVMIRPFPYDGPFPVDYKQQGTSAVIGPGLSLTNNIPFPNFPMDAIPLLIEGKAILYIYGEMYYRDIFKKEHVTKFRLYHGGDRPVCEGGINAAPEGNETDDG